jgi:ribosomal protein S18 acetylase RimI-like enzyme
MRICPTEGIPRGDEAMEIVALKGQDLPDLARLYRQFRGEQSCLEDMRKTFRRLQKNANYTLLGVRVGGSLVASVMGILCEELYGRCRPFMVVEDVIVDRAHRRRGIGSLLMRAIEEEALRNNCGYIMLVTDAVRVEALGFYESLGYHPDRYRACKKYLGAAERKER